MAKRKDVSDIVGQWRKGASPRQMRRCVTCTQWPDVVEATALYLENPVPEVTMHQFYDEVLVDLLGYKPRYDTWMNHVRNCCRYRTR